ncbi:Hypothetical predicted protein [Marmota monax]|uniref:LIM zinc-binding domain-containing protein n=1 Tax=Marmota monax TaxID=9995 RepID=A0A5E4D6G9_MARMO|nr:hypothetical protein GHT09_006249 [Marmota monax]VTJ89755.1 Hypothetical predicted protein [Marmota monax]
MLFHGISGGHIQGIMEEMERRSKTEARLAKGTQLNGRDAGMPPLSPEKPALCAGCGGKISDRYYLLAVDKQWHLRCLKCCECKLALESELTCFAKDGSIYCKEDYYRYSPQIHLPDTKYGWLARGGGTCPILESPLHPPHFAPSGFCYHSPDLGEFTAYAFKLHSPGCLVRMDDNRHLRSS